MPHPDNYDPAAFARKHGDEQYDAALARAEESAAPAASKARVIKAAAFVLVTLLDQTDDLPPLDWDLEDIHAHVLALAEMDVDAWEQGLIDDAMDGDA